MQAYHVTTEAGAASLRQQGADRQQVGALGGVQAGHGFYLAPDRASAEYWQHQLSPQATTIVAVHIPDDTRIAQEGDLHGLTVAAVAWGKNHGWVTADSYLSEALLRHHGADPVAMSDLDETEATWTLLGLYLAEQDYDGYISQWNTLVIINWSLLGPEAFSTAEVAA